MRGIPTKAEKLIAKNFLKEYEDYKNLYNLRNHKNIAEIRDVINKYGENAKINLGGIPMIADDMMSFIKNDIFVFGFGVFIFYNPYSVVSFQNLKWVLMPLLGCTTSVIMVGLLGFIGFESNCDSFKFHCFNAILCNEYSRHCKISSIKKRI